MAEKRRPEEWDRLIDGALRSYANADPAPDLAGRVMQRVHAATETGKAGLWRKWPAFALPAAAAAAMFTALVWQTGPIPQREKPARVAQIAAPPHPAQRTEPVLTAVHRKAAPNTQRHANPRQDVFPAPSRLSPEEEALLAVAQDPRIAKSITGEQKEPGGDIQPLEVSAIQIQSLPAGSERKEN